MGSKNKDNNSKKGKRPASAAGGERTKNIINDSRFATLHSDPRCREPPQKKSKVTIDSRFNRGRRRRKGGKQRRQKEKSKVIESESESDSGTSEEEIEGQKLKKVVAASSESEEDDELESDDSLATTEDSDFDDEVYSEEEDTFVQKEDVPEIDEETKRLAVVNMDWGRVKRMEEEAVHSPVGLFDDENGKDEDSDDEDDDEIDNEKLRAFEMSHLRYYYAVVECDSIATAGYLYKTCDGVKFERPSNKLDYEGLDFHTRALQHSNIELTWYEDEPQRIRTLKRQFNDEQLADLELKEFLASDESENDDSKEGDDREDKSTKMKKKQDTYRALLQSGEGSDGNNEDGDQDMEVTFNTGLEDLSKRILEKKDKQSETVREAYLRKKNEKKKSRKGNSKVSSEDESRDSDQEPIDESEDFFIEEPSAKEDKSTRKEKHRIEASEEAEASRAELELLLADDKAGDVNLKGYNMKPKNQRGRRVKKFQLRTSYQVYIMKIHGFHLSLNHHSSHWTLQILSSNGVQLMLVSWHKSNTRSKL